jgi:N-formylglutamate amidohydrolase
MTPFRLTGTLDGSCPVVLASPHSGQWFPEEFLSRARLPIPALRRLEDAHVGALLVPAAAQGIPLVEATHARAVLDLNRRADEYDPAMIAGRLAVPPVPSERVQRGHGLFPRLAGGGQPIHASRMPAAEAEALLAALHLPWHAALADGLSASREVHGFAILIDMHSMPSLDGPAPATLVIGDRHGRSAAPAIVSWLEAAFRAEGLKVARNLPYAGGYTTERHGRPALGLHAVQLEFDRRLYMDPETLTPHAGFGRLSALIARVVRELVAAAPALALAGPGALAAE